jgi:hypothetical protein
MPIRVHFDEVRDVLHTVAEGVVTDAEFLAAAQEAVADPRYHSGLRSLRDWSKVTECRVTLPVYHRISATGKLHRENRRAIVAPDPIIQEKFLSFARDMQHQDFHLFRTRQDAVDWLNEGLPPEQHID